MIVYYSVKTIISYIIFYVYYKSADEICQTLTLKSSGLVKEKYPKILGDYELLDEKNNERVVYRRNLTDESSSVYLYSLDIEKYKSHPMYDHMQIWQDVWAVRFILNILIKFH